MNAAPLPPSTARAAGTAGALLAACALVAAAAVLGAVPAALGGACGALVLFGGAAFPIVLRWTPVEPSALKLLLVSSLLSPPWLAAQLFVARLAGLEARPATATVLVASALAQLLTVRRRVAFAPLGRAAWGAVALTLALGCAVAAALFAGANGPRLQHDGALWHAGVVGSLDRWWPPEHPWLAATPLPCDPAYDLLAALATRVLGVAAPTAMAWLSAWSAATVPVGLYLFAAPLWREPRRALLAPFVALFGWNALGALAAGLADPGPSAWPLELAAGTPGVPPRQVLYGLAAFLQPGPTAPALAYVVAAWMAAAHALRHGGRPWVGLCGVFHGVALLLDPVPGAAALVATLGVALLRGGVPRRARSVAALVVGALPALVVTRAFGWRTEPVVPFSASASPWALGLPAALPALAVVGLASGRWRRAGGVGDAHGRGTILALALSGVAACGAAAWTGSEAGLRVAALGRAASLPLGVLAAGGVVDLLTGRRVARAAGAGLLLALGLGGVLGLARAARAGARLARVGLPVVECGRALCPLPDPDDEDALDLARAYAWLREDSALRARRPVLVCAVDHDARTGGGFAPHLASLYADLPMWCDRRPELAPGSSRWAPRHERIATLYGAREGWDPALVAEFDALRRPAVWLVEEGDRLRTHRGERDKARRGIDLRLERMGCRPLASFGRVALYLYELGPR